MSTTKTISAEEFDRKVDDGEDVSEYVNWSQATRPGREPKRVNVDFPAWMVDALDKEAGKIGISRQALIKTVINNHLHR